MSNHLYNYSISLIRRSNNSWIIDPVDSSAQTIYKEVLTLKSGNSYLAVKTVSELTYSIFLSGESCHSGVCGWVITLNGWEIQDLDLHLQQSQIVWKHFADASSSDVGEPLCDLLRRLVERHGLIFKSSPIPHDRNIEEQCEVRQFTTQRQNVLPVVEVKELSSFDRGIVGEKKSLFTYFVECYTKHYADFSGRARRREYWGTVLFSILFYLLLMFISYLLFVFGVLESVQGSLEYTLGVLCMVWLLCLLFAALPSLAVAVRRLHDTGRSGWYYLLTFIPVIGPILELFWMCSDSQSEENEYGPNPKA